MGKLLRFAARLDSVKERASRGRTGAVVHPGRLGRQGWGQTLGRQTLSWLCIGREEAGGVRCHCRCHFPLWLYSDYRACFPVSILPTPSLTPPLHSACAPLRQPWDRSHKAPQLWVCNQFPGPPVSFLLSYLCLAPVPVSPSTDCVLPLHGSPALLRQYCHMGCFSFPVCPEKYLWSQTC